MQSENCKQCMLILNETVMNMRDLMSLCEIVIYEVVVSQNVFRAEVSVHASIGGPVLGRNSSIYDYKTACNASTTPANIITSTCKPKVGLP